MKVVWTRSALGDLDHARAYVEANSPGSIGETVQHIRKAVQLIGIDPLNGSRTWSVDGTRETAVASTLFVLIHRMHGAKVELLGILHRSRRWPDGP